jgi:hypothetical protein
MKKQRLVTQEQVLVERNTAARHAGNWRADSKNAI